MRHGGKILVDQLAAHGTRTVFMVPGESFLAALDGLYDAANIQTVICRHEGAASMMAEAAAKLSGTPGIVFVTRGPGAANAVSGVYVAQQDETPLVLFVGLPPAAMEGLRPFQDVDLAALFSGLAKWTAVVRRTADIPAVIARAFQTAKSGRPSRFASHSVSPASRIVSQFMARSDVNSPLRERAVRTAASAPTRSRG